MGYNDWIQSIKKNNVTSNDNSNPNTLSGYNKWLNDIKTNAEKKKVFQQALKNEVANQTSMITKNPDGLFKQLASNEELKFTIPSVNYNADYAEAVKAANALKTADLNALQTEIDNLQSILDIANSKKVKTNTLNKKGVASARAIEQRNAERQDFEEYLKSVGFESIKDIEEQLTEKKAYKGKAQRVQDNIRLSSVANPESENYDTEFEKYAAKGAALADESNWAESTKNIVAKWRNNPKQLESWEKAKNWFNGAISESVLNNQLTYLAAKYMTDDEFAIYNYYLAKETDGLVEKGTAEKFLKSIQDALTDRQGKEISGDKESAVSQYSYGYKVGMDQFTQGLINRFNTVDDYIPSTGTQKASAQIRSEIKERDGIIGQIGYDMISTTSNMLPSILTSTAVGLINPTVGAVVGAGLMGASASGSAYQEMLNLGYDKKQANTYSILVGASEAALSYAFSGISKLGGKVTGNIVKKAIEGIDNGIAKFAIEFGLKIGSEGLEEAAQEVLTPLFENIALGYDKNGFEDINWSEVAYSGLLGMLSSVGFSAVETARDIKNSNEESKRNKRLIKDDLESYMSVGKTQHTRNKKSRMLESGKNPILTSALEIKEFILNTIQGKASGEVRAYGIVGKRLAQAIKDKRNNLDLEGKYLELNADDLRESYKRHSTPKEKGDIALSEDDFVNIPEYIDEFDYVLGVNEYNGKVEIHLAKETDDGYVKILTVSSKERESLQATKIIGISKEKFNEKYGKKIERDTGSLRGLTDKTENSNPSTTAQHTAGTLSNGSVPQNAQSVNNIISTDTHNNSQNPDSGAENRPAFTDVSTKEIYRESTFEDTLAQRDAKQRHITDIAKKLDSDMNIFWVEKSSPKLNGKNGKFVRSTNTMYLAKDVSIVEMYYEVFKHEFVHRLESRGAYKSFKEYLLNRSTAFEHYARAQLKILNGGQEFEGSRDEVISSLTQHYYNQFINDKSIAKPTRDKFTMEDAEREIVADFAGEVLFKGKENRADIAQALSEGDMLSIGNIESSMDALEELANTDRNLFQKIVDVIKEFIRKLSGSPQTKRLVSDLEYIEQRLARVYDSADTKKAANNSGEVKYSINDDFYNQLKKWDKETVGFSFVLGNTSEALKEAGIPDKQIRWDATKIKTLLNKHSGMTIDIIKQIPELLENPVVVIDSKQDSNSKIVMGDLYDEHNKIVTVVLLLSPTSKKGNVLDLIKVSSAEGRGHIQSLFRKEDGSPITIRYKDEKRIQNWLNVNRLQLPLHSTNMNPNDIIDGIEPTVKNKYMQESENNSSDESFSLGSPMQQARENLAKYENGQMSREEYLEENDRLWGEANEKYGIMKQGEKADAPISTPEAVSDDTENKQFVRTLLETGKLTPEMVENVQAQVLLGDFSYKPISDDLAMQKADTIVQNGTAESVWEDAVNDGKRLDKNQIAVGERLLADAIKAGDTYKVLEISSQLADILTRAGQVVQAARLLKKMTGAGRLVTAQRMVKTLNKNMRDKYGHDRPAIKISPKAADRLAKAKTEKGIEHAYQEILQEVADQVPVTFMDKWNCWRYFAMLSNPKTHIRNLVGNGIFVPVVRIKDFIATGIEAGASAAGLIDKSDRTKSIIIKKEYAEFAKNDGKKDAVQQLLKGNKYNDKSAIKEKQQIFKTQVLEFLTRFNSNALEMEDMLFKNKHYIHALAGFLQARNVNLKTVSEDVLTEARIYAVNEAKKATFNDESALADWVQNFGNKNLATSIMVEGTLPFKRTPINIVKRGVEYSPLGLGKTLTKGVYDVKKGKITPTEFIDGLASGLTGTGIMLAGMFLASIGCISGGEDDDKLSDFEKWLGKQEYAVEFLGKSYTIDWAAPACIPFFIGAEIVNTINEGDDFRLSQLGNAVWNSLEPITNLSMLSGIQSVIESTRYAESSQTLAAIAGDAITSYAMQGIPSLLGAVSRTIDQTQRSWYTDKNDKFFDSFSQSISNNVRSKIPGLSYTQIPKIDPWGREVSRGGVGERVLENFVSPGYYSEIEYNDTNEELKRIFVETGGNVLPKTAAKSFSVDGETKYLTADEYVTYAKAKGEYSFDYIKEFMDSTVYDRLTDDQRAKVIENLYQFANAKAKSTVSDYDPAEINTYKTVTRWERNGKSAVNYYIANAVD